VLDADLRRPSQHKSFEIDDPRPGLSDVLAGGAELAEAIRVGEGDRPDVLPAGSIPPDPSELLNSRAFAALLTELRGRYDRVLVDAPPVLPLSDARILGARCDAGLLVLRAGKSARRPSRQAVDQLLSVGTCLLGVVVNGVGGRGSRYGYGDYGYYYSDYDYRGGYLPAPADPDDSETETIDAEAA
jgi:capsular exopolysaccharide synthesis family protein